MAIKLGGLAAKLKAGIDAAERARREEEEAARLAEERAAKAKERAQAAREEMLGELHAFGKQVEHFKVRKAKGALTISFDGRKLVFSPEGDMDRIDVVSDDGTRHHLTRDEVEEWEVVLAEANGPRRLPLELGLEELVTRYLSVPLADAPEEAAEPPAPAPEPTPAPAPEATPPEKKAASAPTTNTTESKRIPAPRGKAPPGSTLRELSNPWD